MCKPNFCMLKKKIQRISCLFRLYSRTKLSFSDRYLQRADISILSSILVTFSMDGFAVVKLSEVIRNVDIVITCTGIKMIILVFSLRAIPFKRVQGG